MTTYTSTPAALRIRDLDRRLGARIAFGPAPSREFTRTLKELGYEILTDADDSTSSLVGGLLIRVAVLEEQLADRAA